MSNERYTISKEYCDGVGDGLRYAYGGTDQYYPSQWENAIKGLKKTLQAKTTTPGASQQVIEPDSGYDGLSAVTVSGDADLVAGNIKKDVEIFGVTGTYEGSGGGTTELGYNDVDFQNTSTDTNIGDQTTGHITTELLSKNTEQVIYTKTAVDLTNISAIVFVFDDLEINSSTANSVAVGVSQTVETSWQNAINNSAANVRKGNTNSGRNIAAINVSDLTGYYYIFYTAKLTFSSSGIITANFRISLI